MLKITNLCKQYGEQVVLNQLNLTLDKGLFGFLGPNGAGKSTLMSIIATLQKPNSGSIQFDGIDVLSDPQALRQQLGYLPQDFGVYDKISAEKLLTYLAKMKGLNNASERKDQIEFLLSKTNLWQHRKKAVSSYSGGMKQRFGVAQALLGNPNLLIIDEPTAGLDPEERNRFYDLLSELGESRTIILSTHIVEDVDVLCSQLGVLSNGRIAAQGSPTELRQCLANQIWRKLISREELGELDGEVNIVHKRMVQGKYLATVISPEQPEGFSAHSPELEDVYFSLLTGMSLTSASNLAEGTARD